MKKPLTLMAPTLVVIATTLSGVTWAESPPTRKAAAAPAPASNRSATSDAQINNMVRNGRGREAARDLETQTRRAPGNKTLKTRAARVYETLGDLPAAKEAAAEALTGTAPDPAAHAVLGRIAAREGDWAAAVGHFRNAVLAQPNDAALHLDYGNALEHIGDQAGADAEHARYRSLAGMKPAPVNDSPAR